MDEKRRAARWRDRRIIYNNDGDDVREAANYHEEHWQLLKRTGGALSADLLNARSTPLLGTQVDSIWYSTCFAGLTFSHHTKEGDFYGKGVPQELVDSGRDNLQVQVDFCHQNDMEAFWSLRMNDTHDAFPKGLRTNFHRLAPFKQEHPEYIMGEPSDWDTYPTGPKHQWSSLDFSYLEVRDHILSLIREVCQGYDVDGVELDFFRAPRFFPPTMEGLPVEPRHLDMMTDLLRRVNTVADEVGEERGRPLLLAVRVPSRVEAARFIGLDLERWLEEDYVDLLIAGDEPNSTMTESFVEIVKLGHSHNVPVYPCIPWLFWHYWAFLDMAVDEHRTLDEWIANLYCGDPKDLDKPCYLDVWNAWEGAASSLRGAASNLWNAGADGIYVFNGFCGPDLGAWNELGDPKALAKTDKVFGADWFTLVSGAKARELELNQGELAVVHFQIGENSTDEANLELRCRLHLWNSADGDDLYIKLNHYPLDEPTRDSSTNRSTRDRWLEYVLDPSVVVKPGENRVELLLKNRCRAATAPLVLDAVQLHLHHR